MYHGDALQKGSRHVEERFTGLTPPSISDAASAYAVVPLDFP